MNSGDDTAYVIIQLADRHPPAYLTHDDVIVHRVEEEQDPPPGGAVVTTIVTSEPRDEIEYRILGATPSGKTFFFHNFVSSNFPSDKLAKVNFIGNFSKFFFQVY